MPARMIVKICRRALAVPAILRVVRPVARFCFSHIHPQVIVKVEGGICSQIRCYLVGMCFAERGHDVRYDLDWYRWSGKDNNGVYERNFDLLKLNSKLPFRQASELLSLFYRYCLLIDSKPYDDNPADKSWATELTPPLYVGGFFHDFEEMYSRMLPAYFPFGMLIGNPDRQNKVILQEIESAPSVAMHVRRGDLAAFNPYYGEPCSMEYFCSAVREMAGDGSVHDFYIFSDEPGWCGSELLPTLPTGQRYHIVSANGSDRGYMDLLLMASCKHVITSKGSLGKYAALINPIPGRRVILHGSKTEERWVNLLSGIGAEVSVISELPSR